MKPEQFNKALEDASDQVTALLTEHELRLLSALHRAEGKLGISISIGVVNLGATAADVAVSIGYIVDRTKEKTEHRVIFDQEELPLPEPTRSGRRKAS